MPQYNETTLSQTSYTAGVKASNVTITVSGPSVPNLQNCTFATTAPFSGGSADWTIAGHPATSPTVATVDITPPAGAGLGTSSGSLTISVYVGSTKTPLPSVTVSLTS